LMTKRSLKVMWTGIHNREEAVHPFLMPKTSMVHDLTDNLAKLVTLAPGGTGKIRVFEVSKDGKTQKEFTGSEMIGNIPEPVELYAEVYLAAICVIVAMFTRCSSRKFLARSLRPMIRTKSLVSSIFRRNCHGLTAYPSSLLSNE
jgi:Ubiquitin-specific protease C-terminal